jgi:hypothetical protein
MGGMSLFGFVLLIAAVLAVVCLICWAAQKANEKWPT